jgi:chromate transporter
MAAALELFLTFFKIGALSFGGAYSFLPLLEREIVTNHGWLDPEEFASILGMVHAFPGAISIKFATYVGYRELGVVGILLANIANFLPPAFLIFGLGAAYERFGDTAIVKQSLVAVRYAALGLIAALVWKFGMEYDLHFTGMFFALAAFAATSNLSE